MSSTITWRTYRDESRAPVPVLRKALARTAYKFIPEVDFTGDVALVEEYTEALGLYTKTRWTGGNTLPTASMRDEPILLTLKRPYGGSLIKFAVPNGFSGAGYNAYLEPRIVTIDDAPHLLIPPHPRQTNKPGEVPVGGDILDTGDTSMRTFVAAYLGNKAYQIPAGFVDVQYVTVGSEQHVSGLHYDPYHGVIVIDNAVEGPSVLITVSQRYRLSRPISTHPDVVTPVIIGDRLYGFMTSTLRSDWEDARRLPERLPGARVDSMFYDGEPVSTGHLWVIQSTADSERVEEAVRYGMPAGTLYRQVATHTPDKPTLVAPLTGSTLADEVTFRWEGPDDAVFYHLQVATDAAFSTVRLNQTSLSDTTYTTSVITPDVTLYWRVRMYDGISTSAWSDAWSLTMTDTTPPTSLAYVVTEGVFTTNDGKTFGVVPYV